MDCPYICGMKERGSGCILDRSRVIVRVCEGRGWIASLNLQGMRNLINLSMSSNIYWFYLLAYIRLIQYSDICHY